MDLKKIKETIQSSHVNFLIGAGLSTPFLPLLGDIETRLSATTDEKERNSIKKEYFEKVMLPNWRLVNGKLSSAEKTTFSQTNKNYVDFFESVSTILLKRGNPILSKQVNIFTTNIDILMESSLEEIGLEYSDGFSGMLNPTFSLSNFKKSILKHSLHFENVSEIPLFNLLKIHGSLTWFKEGDKVRFSKLSHFDDSLLKAEGNDFTKAYGRFAIVNPEKKKLEETVIDLKYYELLRMYSSELEKENVALFVMGFSMNDEHIREITIRAANSNPTLKIYIFCYNQDSVTDIKAKMNGEQLRYSNVEFIGPDITTEERKGTLTMDNITSLVFKKIIELMSNEPRQ